MGGVRKGEMLDRASRMICVRCYGGVSDEVVPTVSALPVEGVVSADEVMSLYWLLADEVVMAEELV